MPCSIYKVDSVSIQGPMQRSAPMATLDAPTAVLEPARTPPAPVARRHPTDDVVPVDEAARDTIPDVTVVLCTWNRADRLGPALDSLAALETGGTFRFEVLVVDNGSTDDTQAVVRARAERASVPVRSVIERERGVVAARNRGVREARGAWIAFFDDDQLASRDWLRNLLAIALRREVQVAGGRVRLKLPEGTTRPLPPFCRVLLGESVGMDRERKYDYRVTPGAGNLLVHRDVFEAVGLFDPAYARRGEDTELFRRILKSGRDGWYAPDAVVNHVIPADRLTDEFFLRTSQVMGSGMADAERNAWGPWLYPAVWLARAVQCAGRLWPRLVAARRRGDAEAELGVQCRLVVAHEVLRRGLTLLPPWRTAQGQNRSSEVPRLADAARDSVPSSSAFSTSAT